MNERIRELAQEVFSFKYKSNPNELNPDHNMDHIHKFAELIVRECVSICKERERPNLYGVREVETTIKQHFGVEK